MDRKQIHKSEKHWANSVSSGYKYIPISFSFFFERLIYLRKRERVHVQEGQREKRESLQAEPRALHRVPSHDLNGNRESYA